MLGLLSTLLAVFFLYCVLVVRRTGLITPSTVFLYANIIMAVGTFQLLDPTLKADVAYAWVVFSANVCFMLVSALVVSYRAPSIGDGAELDRRLPLPEVFIPSASVAFLITLSIAVLIGYFASVGTSALIEGLHNSFSGGELDVTGVRLNAYAGSDYFFPGYVNQFKNSLLPALVLVVITYWVSTAQRHPVLTAILVGISIFGLTGTGQRLALVQFIICTVIFIYFLHGRRFSRALVRVGLLGLTIVTVSTIALGRSNATLTPGAGLLERITATLVEFIERILQDQQLAAVYGFRYIYYEPVKWGAEWGQALLGVFPGASGTDLPNRIYETLYGSLRGTASPSVWGSAYHNFGWFGVIALPALLAIILGVVSKRISIPKQRNTLEIMGMAGVTAVIGLWMAGTPVVLINNGLVVYLFLWLWGARTPARDLSPKLVDHLIDVSRSIDLASPAQSTHARKGTESYRR